METKNSVIYARTNTNEQKIEEQLKVIKEYVAREGYNIIFEYIDRITDDTDERPQFKKMIKDSARRKFEYVIVSRLDRFSRDRYDSATSKVKLKKNGVTVVSATESITDAPAGIMVEGILESMAEYYSAELSMKIKQGIEAKKNKRESEQKEGE